MDTLFLVGLSIIMGFAGGKLFKKLKFPSVVGYLIMGIILGPSLLNILELPVVENMDIISDFALGIVAFSIGTSLRIAVMRNLGAGVFTIILGESFGAFILVAAAVYLLTKKMYLALVFGALAPASAPAGTWVVLQEYRAKGPLTNTILAVVGLDDGLAIFIYAFAAAIAKVLIVGGHTLSFKQMILTPVAGILSAILMGGVIGLILISLLRKLQDKKDYFILSLGAIVLCTGLSKMFDLSLILSNMILGMVMANTYLITSKRASEVIENITPPVYVMFFVLAGAHLQIKLLLGMGVLGIVYIIGRTLGLISGAFIGASIAKADENIRKYLGFAILSQAGVAIGLALLISKEFGPLGEAGKQVALLAINTIAATTIFFEVVGPFTTKYAITKAGEAGRKK
ncbi:MAG: cation:proton antiporter [Endomicrobiales bacterium]|nr:cation:proton antiporter [Endomicrobiales bacterium]